MWLAGFRKENKGFFIQEFSSINDVKKIIQFSEAEVTANFDITPTSIHDQRFTGYVYDCGILNDWTIQNQHG